MENLYFEDLLDPDVLFLASESLPEIIIAVFGVIGASAALVTFLFFITWGSVQVVKFMRSIIKA